MHKTYPHSELSGKIIACAIKVHRYLGPGLLESAYEESLAAEFEYAGLSFQRQPQVAGHYKGRPLDLVFIPDFIVDGRIIVEIKSVSHLHDNHIAQVLTYLKVTNCQIGLLLNFHEERLYRGIKRLIWSAEPGLEVNR